MHCSCTCTKDSTLVPGAVGLNGTRVPGIGLHLTVQLPGTTVAQCPVLRVQPRAGIRRFF
jgi:hypothetical protein